MAVENRLEIEGFAKYFEDDLVYVKHVRNPTISHFIEAFDFDKRMKGVKKLSIEHQNALDIEAKKLFEKNIRLPDVDPKKLDDFESADSIVWEVYYFLLQRIRYYELEKRISFRLGMLKKAIEESSIDKVLDKLSKVVEKKMDILGTKDASSEELTQALIRDFVSLAQELHEQILKLPEPNSRQDSVIVEDEDKAREAIKKQQWALVGHDALLKAAKQVKQQETQMVSKLACPHDDNDLSFIDDFFNEHGNPGTSYPPDNAADVAAKIDASASVTQAASLNSTDDLDETVSYDSGHDSGVEQSLGDEPGAVTASRSDASEVVGEEYEAPVIAYDAQAQATLALMRKVYDEMYQWVEEEIKIGEGNFATAQFFLQYATLTDDLKKIADFTDRKFDEIFDSKAPFLEKLKDDLKIGQEVISDLTVTKCIEDGIARLKQSEMQNIIRPYESDPKPRRKLQKNINEIALQSTDSRLTWVLLPKPNYVRGKINMGAAKQFHDLVKQASEEGNIDKIAAALFQGEPVEVAKCLEGLVSIKGGFLNRARQELAESLLQAMKSMLEGMDAEALGQALALINGLSSFLDKNDAKTLVEQVFPSHIVVKEQLQNAIMILGIAHEKCRHVVGDSIAENEVFEYVKQVLMHLDSVLSACSGKFSDNLPAAETRGIVDFIIERLKNLCTATNEEITNDALEKIQIILGGLSTNSTIPDLLSFLRKLSMIFHNSEKKLDLLKAVCDILSEACTRQEEVVRNLIENNFGGDLDASLEEIEADNTVLPVPMLEEISTVLAAHAQGGGENALSLTDRSAIPTAAEPNENTNSTTVERVPTASGSDQSYSPGTTVTEDQAAGAIEDHSNANDIHGPEAENQQQDVSARSVASIRDNSLSFRNSKKLPKPKLVDGKIDRKVSLEFYRELKKSESKGNINELALAVFKSDAEEIGLCFKGLVEISSHFFDRRHAGKRLARKLLIEMNQINTQKTTEIIKAIPEDAFNQIEQKTRGSKLSRAFRTLTLHNETKRAHVGIADMLCSLRNSDPSSITAGPASEDTTQNNGVPSASHGG